MRTLLGLACGFWVVFGVVGAIGGVYLGQPLPVVAGVVGALGALGGFRDLVATR